MVIYKHIGDNHNPIVSFEIEYTWSKLRPQIGFKGSGQKGNVMNILHYHPYVFVLRLIGWSV
jgi:hypothetical protein